MLHPSGPEDLGQRVREGARHESVRPWALSVLSLPGE